MKVDTAAIRKWANGSDYYTGSEVRLQVHSMADCIDALRDALSAPARQDGWQLVPVEPTPEMCKIQTWDFNQFYPIEKIWPALLAAAPRPAPAEPQTERDLAAEVDHWMKRSKAWRMRAETAEFAVSEFHHAVKDAGWHPGRTDDSLPDIIRAKGAELRAARWVPRERLSWLVR